MEMKASAVLNIKASAGRLGVSPFTLRTWLRQGRLPYFRVGRRIVLAEADVERFLVSNRVPAREEGRGGTAS